MTKPRYSKIDQDNRVYNNIGKDIHDWLFENIDDFLYEYCCQKFAATANKSTPFFKPYIEAEFKKRNFNIIEV